MPNWCEVQLVITGTEQEIAEFYTKHCANDEFSFNTVIPEPSSIEECPAAFIIPAEARHNDIEDNWFDWYGWHNYYWGTKWEARTYHIVHDLDRIYIEFDTAWAPPIPVIQKLGELYPIMEFECRYFEGGCLFGGVCYGDGGILTISDKGLRKFATEYGFISEETWDECYTYNDETWDERYPYSEEEGE